MPKPITRKQKQEAAQKAITKWHDIAYEHGEDRGPANCGYCQLYYYTRSRHETCNGCPVYKATGERFCRKTPYRDWVFERTNDQTTPEKAKKAAIEELHFLVCLQPPGKKIVVNDEWEYSWHWETDTSN